MTPEQEAALMAMLMGSSGMYGSPLVEGATSQLNLVQDIGATTFDTVFMYNAGLITSEQLLDTIKNATREPVGDPNEYDWESQYNMARSSNNTDMIQAMDSIRAGISTAADEIMKLRVKYGEAAVDGLESWQLANIDDMKKQLEEFERKFRNRLFVDEKIATGEYEYDMATGMLYKPLLGEDARENLRAAGWKGPFSDPEFWRVVPDEATMEQAAKLQEQFAPAFEAAEKDEAIATSRTRGQIASISPAMKKYLEKYPEKAQEVVQTTGGQKEIEDAYKKALADFKMPENTKAAGFEDLGVINGIRYEVTKEGGKEILRGYDRGGKVVRMAETPQGIQHYRDIAKTRKEKPTGKQSFKVGVTGNSYIVYEGGKSYLEQRTAAGDVIARQPLITSQKAPAKSQASQANDYAARQAAYYSAKSTGIQQEERKKKAAEGEAAVKAKVQEAKDRGTVPALQWLAMMPQYAALASQPAPKESKPGRPAPRVLSDDEINTMANMIAGGLV